MKKIAIFGQGYVGSYLINDEQNVYELHSYNKKEHRYNETDHLISILETSRPDYVVNACGYTGRPNVDSCESDKQTCWELNVNLPVTMSTICDTLNIPFIHISSGCIYTGYDKEYTELDKPNFGLDSTDSSWYSKTKHAAEIAMKKSNAYIFRIRMPFCDNNHERNFLNKVLKYDNLIEFENSMTSIHDFVTFIWKFINRLEIEKTVDSQQTPKELKPGIYNVCNPGAVTIRDVVERFKDNGIANSNWSFVDIESLNLKANRSNCVLDCSKIQSLNLGLPPASESLSKSVATLCKQLLWKTGLQGPKTGLEWQIK